MRSRLAGLASKPILHSRVFSTAPVHGLRINPFGAFFSKLGTNQTPEFVTAEGLRNVTKFSKAHALARAKASLKTKDAHNCYLHFTSEGKDALPVFRNENWRVQAGAALKIVEHEQRLALVRAGIPALWLAIMHADPKDPRRVGVAFRLPKKVDLKAFAERLRAAGLVGGELLVFPRKMDELWEAFIKDEADGATGLD